MTTYLRDEAHLEDAEVAWAQHRHLDALQAACMAWRLQPVAEIGSFLRACSARVPQPVAKPPRTRVEFHAVWMRVAAEEPGATATGWLASTLSLLVPEVDDRFGMLRPDWMGEKHAALFSRITELEARCPDPRIADAALAILREGKFGFWDLASVERVYRPVVKLLVAARDPTLAPAVRELAATPRSKRATVRQWCQEQLPLVADRLEATAPAALPPRLVARWAALVPPAPGAATARDAETLLAEVLARPDDDAVRHVLADALLEVEDPRGQLVSLQLGGAGEDDPRVRKLVRAHQRAWLGDPLDATLMGVVFRRGFPDEAGLRSNASAERAVWEAAAQDPRLATFRTLRQGQGNRDHYLRFVCSEQMRDLRHVELPTKAFLDALGDGPIRPLETVVLGFAPKRPVLKAIVQAPGFATVTGLLMAPGFDLAQVLADLRAVGLADRLVGFGVTREGFQRGTGLLAALETLAEALPALGWVQLARGRAVRAPDGEGWVLELHGEQGAKVVYFVDGVTHGAVWHGDGQSSAQLPKLPPSVVGVRISGVSPEMVTAVAEVWSVPIERV